MLAMERRAKIESLIKTRGSVQVEDLAQELNVSAMTIRRDLIKLQNEDKIKRCHGGAITKQEITYADKRISHKQEKESIAKICCHLISEGDTIFLDAGTTTYEIANLIKDIPEILIVTNDLEIARLLMDSSVELFICGGHVQKSTGSMFGRHATQMLTDFKFNIGFFGAAAINNDCEVMTPTMEKMWLKRETPKQCEKAYLVVDSSKFGIQAMTKINHLKDYTGIITDKIFSEEEKEKLNTLDITIIQND